MSNPNLVLIFSPAGEPFETSRANARDLTSHAGWSFSPPAEVAAVAVAEASKPVEAPKEPEVAQTPPSSEGGNADEGSEGTDDEGTGEEAGEEGTAEEEGVIFTTAEQFEGMDREAVVAYLAKNFPDYKPHHLTKVEKLVVKAIELAQG